MSPINRKKLKVLRKRLDKLDNSFIKLIKKRTLIIKQVLKLKKSKNEIVDKKRIRFILNQIRKKSIKNKKGKKITVEVDNISQLKKIIGLKFDRVLFDNMSVKNLRKAVKMSRKYYETEASGGITLKNIKKISSTGVQRISIGQITHSAPTVGCRLDFIS